MTDCAPIAVEARAVPPRSKPFSYPEPFFSRMAGREKHPLGDRFGLRNLGVNLTRLSLAARPPCSIATAARTSASTSWQASPPFVTDDGTMRLFPGLCAGFLAGGRAHHLVNRTDRGALYLEVGGAHPATTAPIRATP
jgi:uncharacterized cupin superfamily protein